MILCSQCDHTYLYFDECLLLFRTLPDDTIVEIFECQPILHACHYTGCQNNICDSCLLQCSICNKQPLCNYHTTSCNSCQSLLCQDHQCIRHCHICSNPICNLDICAIACENICCFNIVCVDCVNNSDHYCLLHHDSGITICYSSDE
jgi:hypothetical protein